ncbi:type VI secretion system tip protein VgrG [Viridibacterium curvum]|uniref:VgrG-related protein n=1 Tax=Viridibacterium curvum TaxID=1101404 RepID=A0ABP9QU80_9RHOO
MSDTRALPVAAEHREFIVKVDGKEMSKEHQLLSVSISLVVNRIASARLVYLDGSAASSDFPLGNGDLLLPGKKIEILAGAGKSSESIFTGLIVQQQIKVREASAPQLIVECRHAAMKMTAVRSNAGYFDQSDSGIIEALLGKAGITGDIDPTSLKHKQMLQVATSDWDFLLARAQANGLLIWPDADKLAVKKPATDGASACTLQFGATLLEFDAEIDARQQYKAVRSIAWDPAQQSLLEVDGATPGFSGPGNLNADDLAAVAAAERQPLRNSGLVEAEAQAWADGEWLRSRVNKVCGRGKCEGIASIKPGGVVTLSGVGARCNGKVFVTGVRHVYDLVQGWKTHVQFGGLDRLPPDDMSAPPAGALLARVAGLQIGIVVSNEDPDGEDRVRVRLPMIDNAEDGIWARVASLDAGKERGFFFRPEIDDEVVVGFLDEDPRHGIILGMLHSSAKPAPFKGSDDNHLKGYVSREKMKLTFDDEKKVIVVETPAGNSITISDDDKSIVLADQHSNKITMNADGIKIESSKALELKAGTEARMESGTGFSAKGGTELKLEGGTQAEISSSAVTKVKGGIVQIN